MGLRLVIVSCCAILLHLGSCKPEATQVETFKGPTLFERQNPDSSGIVFANEVKEDWQTNIMLNSYLYNGGGVAVLDIDGDGLEDLYFTSTMGANRLYRNLGNWKFEDITEKAGVAAVEGIKTGVSVFDVNSDGKPDLYISRTGSKPGPLRANLLFVNQGNNRFVEQAAQYGLADASASSHSNFFDFDNDGDLDLYLINNPVEWSRVNSIQATPVGDGYVRNTQPWTPSDSDRLFENRNGQYVDVTIAKGLINRAWGLSVTAADLNADGHDDLYIGNDYIEPDQLLINDGKGGFADKASEWLSHTSAHTMGVDIADLDGDALPDIVSLDMLAPDLQRRKRLMTTMVQGRFDALQSYGYGKQLMRNNLQINTGDGFQEEAHLRGIEATDWSWAPLAADFNLDGRRDLFVTNGYRRDISNLDYLNVTVDSVQKNGGLTDKTFSSFEEYAKLIPSAALSNFGFAQTADGTFENQSAAWGVTRPSYSSGAAYADLDNDGDLDLIVSNIDQPADLYRNMSRERGEGQFLSLSLKGSIKNFEAIGASVRVVANGQVNTAEVRRTRGFQSSVSPRLIFGFAPGVTQVDSLIIRFPNGKGLIKTALELNQQLQFSESEAEQIILPSRIWRRVGKDGRLRSPATQVAANASGLNFLHKENEFDDFNREPMLPHRLSRQGPCLASGDIDANQRLDLFVGGAAGQPGMVYVQTQSGKFVEWPGASAALQKDAAFEDVGAAWFDIDQDGDLDLYVVSGDNAQPGQHDLYRDRLYLNDGRSLQAASYVVGRPKVPGSFVLPFDADGDGDLDLLVGSRNLPGQYPKSVASVLLRNDSGKLVEASAELMPGLKEIGMATDACLADLSGDEAEEIVIVGEWMAPQVFTKVGNSWQRSDSPLDSMSGWYNCVVADNTTKGGLTNILVGNLGTNHRHKPPLYLYAADFDGNGQLDPVFAVKDRGDTYPLAMRDMLVKQMPGLKKKFARYKIYAEASMADIFGEDKLQQAQMLKVSNFASLMYKPTNSQVSTLPMEAQSSAVRCALSLPDGSWILAGNDFDIDAETGQLDASDGVLLDAQGQVLSAALGLSGAVTDMVLVGEEVDVYLVAVANNNGPLQLVRVAKPQQLQ